MAAELGCKADVDGKSFTSLGGAFQILKVQTQTRRGIQKVDPPIMVLLCCRLQNPKVDLLFGSAQGSGDPSLTGQSGVWDIELP